MQQSYAKSKIKSNGRCRTDMGKFKKRDNRQTRELPKKDFDNS